MALSIAYGIVASIALAILSFIPYEDTRHHLQYIWTLPNGLVCMSVYVVQVIAVASSLESNGGVTRVAAHTSDLIELVSGVSPVSF